MAWALLLSLIRLERDFRQGRSPHGLSVGKNGHRLASDEFLNLSSLSALPEACETCSAEKKLNPRLAPMGRMT
ncbi:hypothetical protein CU048_00765 [Beijerinckiaceae bacterium]|nr:hypothetical protein CU048_00765 [Beijerinckiaceae bacterium]